MKKLVFLVIAGALSQALRVQGVMLDGVAAKVNAAVITHGDVMTELRRTPEAEAHLRSTTDETQARMLYDAAVDTLIDRQLILEAAAVKKMEMQEWVIDNRIREIVKANFEGDRNKLEQELTRRKIPYAQWRQTIRDDMIIAAMRYQIIEKNAIATPGAMQKEYAQHKDRYGVKASTSVSVILLKPSDGKDAPSVTTRGEEILERLNNGESFSELARKHSSDSHAQEGGLWKDINPSDAFREEIADVIARLKVGENSRLVNLDGWGFIVRKEAETLASERSFTDAYEDIAEVVRNNWSKKEYGEWMKRLRAQAFVKKYPMPNMR